MTLAFVLAVAVVHAGGAALAAAQPAPPGGAGGRPRGAGARVAAAGGIEGGIGRPRRRQRRPPTPHRRPGRRRHHGDPPGPRVGIDRLRPADRRRLRRAWALAATPVLVAYTWLLTVGNWDLFQRQYFDDFFDAQARSMLDGRWDVPPEVVGFEGFLVGGKTYIYFGPFRRPAGMPLLASPTGSTAG